MGKITTRRICKNAVLLAMICVIGMFSIPLGANIKVSLQLLMVLIICLTAESFIDPIIITSLYLLLGLFIPIYAGFNAGISPTFGYVISFVVISPIIYFINKMPKVHYVLRMFIACFTGLLVCYLIGTIFMMLYLSMDFTKVLMISVVPYLPFDVIKIVLSVIIVVMLPDNIKGQQNSK